MLQALISYLLSAWEGALHSRDSAFQVAQAVPDWKQRYQEALVDPLRMQYTTDQFSTVRKLFDAIFEGTVTDSMLGQLVRELEKLPN
jgi:hypothetical protein